MRSVSKALRFPLGGVARNYSFRETTYPSEDSVYSSPLAVNVLGECAFFERIRGGSRPGLKAFTGSQPSQVTSENWLWPNGERIIWADSVIGEWSFSGPSYVVGMFVRYDAEMFNGWGLYHPTLGIVSSCEAPEDASSLSFTMDVENAVVANRTIRGRDEMIYLVDSPAVTPGGSRIVNQHDTFSIKVTKGALPTGITVMAKYRDRLVCAKDNVWFASRTSDYGDFDLGGEAEDVSRPMAGTISYAGQEGEPITAVIPVGDSILYIATKRRICAIKEEPTTGLSTISENVGIISRDAWCNADGSVFFVGTNGLYGLSEGSAVNVSQNVPEAFKGLSSAFLVYDAERKGIHIFTNVKDWFYDIGNKAFWEVSYPVAKRPTAGGLAVIDNINRIVFKCADNVWRYWDDSFSTDDGTDIASKVAIGPFKCGNGDTVDGILDRLSITLGAGSGTVEVKVFTAKSAEQCVTLAANNQSASASFSAAQGWNTNVHTRCRGSWAIIVLSSNNKWAYESLVADIKNLGGLRYE